MIDLDLHILDGHTVVKVDTWKEYSDWWYAVRTKKKSDGSNNLCRVAKTEFNDYLISTVFVGATMNGLFETMVFKGDEPNDELEEYTTHTKTWDEAEKVHAEIVNQIHELVDKQVSK